MEILGYVGAAENKLLGYLIAVSRKLAEPLSGIVVSSAGAGKSKLVDIIQKLTPPEDVVFTSKLTPQSLYYMPKDFLKHKLLIVEERTGSELADYAIRTLQSKGSLRLAAPVRGKTHLFEVEGPVSVLETTTSVKLNPENISRCFILHLDESKEQTERIHNYQRYLKAQEPLKLKDGFDKITAFHHNIQRQLNQAQVIIPYAQKLSFPVGSPLSRRDNQRFLTLIESVALLYQHQRRHLVKGGISFIKSSPKDYRVAYELFTKSYHNSMMFTHPKAALLLDRINHMNKGTFTRADIAKYSSWPHHQVRDNMKYLEDTGTLEVISKRRGKKALYRVNSHIKLTKPEELEEGHSFTT